MQYRHKTCATSPGPGPIVRWPTSGAPLGSQSLSVVDMHVVWGFMRPALALAVILCCARPWSAFCCKLQVAEPAPRLFPLDLLLELRALAARAPRAARAPLAARLPCLHARCLPGAAWPRAWRTAWRRAWRSVLRRAFSGAPGQREAEAARERLTSDGAAAPASSRCFRVQKTSRGTKFQNPGGIISSRWVRFFFQIMAFEGWVPSF